MRVRRLAANPIIRPEMDARMGGNVNGPSLVRAPAWLPRPLGRYYLYFAHHQGTYIRLAYADAPEGPWTTYAPGALALEESFAVGHVASPDVHADDDERQIRMYYHGPDSHGAQWTRLATSSDGVHFTARPEILGAPYFRVFPWGGYHYALGMPGILYRSADGVSGFVRGPTLFGSNMRHSALKLDGSVLSVFHTNAGTCPERILVSTIDVAGDWMTWRASEPTVLLEPETEYEGAALALEPSARGPAPGRVRQLRDPCVFRDEGRTYLLYAVAGESGIAIAELEG